MYIVKIVHSYIDIYILAVKSDSLLALENKPMLIKKAKKDFYSVIPILVMFALIIIFNIMGDNWNTYDFLQLIM